MGDELLDRDVHLLALLQEGNGLGIVLSTVVPRADDVDLLVAHSEVRVDLVLAVVDEEAHLAHAATATDVIVDISGGNGSAGALICEVNANAVCNCLDLCDALLQSVLGGTLEANGGLSTHALGNLEAILVAVHGDDVVDTGGAQDGDHHQTHRAATLNQNLRTEVQKAGLLASLQSVDAYASQLKDHALIEVELIRGGAASGTTYFQVNELNLSQRMILELACVCVHALERGQKTGLLNFGSKVLVQGCGPVGLVMITVLRAAGINHVIAVDGNEDRLKVAQRMGAKTTICFKRPDEDTLEKRVAKVQSVANGVGVDFAYQCTGAPVAAADIYSYIRRGGGMCEMGFFVNNGEYSINPHFAMCNKEIDIVGSWDYSAEDYPKTVAFLKQCQELNIPIEELITHSYSLDEMNEAMETNVAQKGIKIAYIAK